MLFFALIYHLPYKIRANQKQFFREKVYFYSIWVFHTQKETNLLLIGYLVTFMFYPICGHVIILNFKNLYLKWNKSRVVSKYHDCQVIHSSCSIVACTYIVACRRWLFSLPLIVMFCKLANCSIFNRWRRLYFSRFNNKCFV